MSKGVDTGTINLVSPYVAPERVSRYMDDADAKKLYTGANAEKLADGIYSLAQQKATRAKHYNTAVLMRIKRGRWMLTAIPTNKAGQVLEEAMVERLLDVEYGDRDFRERNVMVDIGVDAEKMVTPKDLANSYRWYIHPNESDVKNIDDANSKIVEIVKKHKGKAPTRAIITGGTEKDRQTVVNTLRDSFTAKERKYLTHCIIRIGNMPLGVAGSFQGNSDAQGKPIGIPYINIGSAYADKADVVTHEAIHALREFDQSRDTKLTAVKAYVGRDADLEESLTEAETVTREKPFDKPEIGTGYYHHIKIPSKGYQEMEVEDRITVVGADDYKNKNKKGKRAQKTVLMKYPMMNISKLKIKGEAEAIDSYYNVEDRVKGQRTKVHVYAPKATKQGKVDKELKDDTPGAKVIRWDDGKAKVIQDGSQVIGNKKASKAIVRKTVKTGDGKSVEIGLGIVQGRRGRHVKLH
jgi:hypothetical protein